MPQRKRIYRTALLIVIASLACERRPDAPGSAESTTSDEGRSTPASARVEVPSTPTVIAHTSGPIARASSIHVEFDQAMQSESSDDARTVRIQFEPELSGEIEWVSPTRLLFKPADPLPRKAKYAAIVQIDGKDAGRFEFWAVPQSFEVRWIGLEGSSREVRRFSGEVTTRDVADAAAVEKMLSAKIGDQSFAATWQHSEDGQRHRFQVEGIKREEAPRTLNLVVDGASLEVEHTVRHRVTIPGLGTFAALSARGRGRTGPIEIHFSDPIAPGQAPTGLFTTQSKKDLRIDVRGNVVRLYSARAWGDVELVRVSKLVRSENGRRLKRDRVFRITQAAQKPTVKFLGKGTILPLKAGVAVPIETASLRAVRVKAIRVPPSNLGQFFQINALDGTTEMQRVGKVVWRQRVELGPDLGGGPVRHGLDLSKLVEKQGQGLYHVELSFRPEDTNYDCPAGAFPPWPEEEEADVTDYAPAEQSNWDYAWGAWISGVDPGARYRERHNPCHIAYYMPVEEHDIRVARNVLLTNIAIVAKKDPQNRLSVFASDLLTTEPLVGADVEAYDYTHHKLGEGKTSIEGAVTLASPARPYTILVRHRGQLGAIRLHDSESLTVSHFDVGGAEVKKGIKGFLFGERGVWRPGDTMYLNFILKDDDGRLPEDHPILFTLRGPRGAVVDSKRITESVGRFYAITTRTGREAPTGVYQAEVTVGGATFSKSLSVEAVIPNRLKIELDFGTELLEGPTAKLDTTLRSRWLHGAIARGLRSEVDVAFASTKTRFPKYEEYAFDDPTRKLRASAKRLFEGVLDDNGEVKVQRDVELDGAAPGMAQATFTTRIFEESGQSSTDRHAIRFSPYERYVGVKIPKGDRARGMLLTDVDHPVDIVAVDAKGQPVDTTVSVRIYKINWRWWWEKGTEDLSQYAGQRSYRKIADGKAQIVKGRGKWTFQIKYPSWGRYLLVVTDDKGGHQTGKVFYADWPGWAGRGQKDNPGGPAVLTVVADKPRVEVNETVTVSFPSPKQGRALVTLENGQRVVKSDWIETSSELTEYEFVAEPNMTPNVFVHVMLLQPYDHRGNDHPIRLYGVTPVMVRDPQTQLEPAIEAPTEMVPGTQQVISVSEAKGRAMTYSLAIVDEGLLGLTRHRTPNPWGHFYRREGLGVKTWDNFNHVAGGYAGALETLLAIGGGAKDGEDDGAKARRFPPVVIVRGPFALAEGEKKAHRIDIPTYLGEVRAMVVAGNRTAYGAAGRSIFVRKPVMAYATVPRVLAPQDRLELPVTVFTTLDGPHDVEVTLQARGGVQVAQSSKTLRFTGSGEAAVTFDVEVGNEPGAVQFEFAARSGKASHREQVDVEVRYPNPPEVTVATHSLAPGGEWAPKLVREGLRGVSAEVEIYRGRAMGLGRRIQQLIGYPHGCLEQTTARAFPQVFLNQIQALTVEEGDRVQVHVKAAVDKLQRLQSPSGGFGVWPNGRSHDWTSSWVGHFLLEAQRAGFVVSEDSLSRWQSYQEQQARRWSEFGGDRAHLAQAYRLYTLALASKPDLSSMNRLREQPNLEPLAAIRLAVAYALAGSPEVAQSLIPSKFEYQDSATPDPSFGSGLRDRAMVLEAYVLLGKARQAQALADELAAALDSDRGLSTQETAYALLAMSRFSVAMASGPEPDVEVEIGGQKRKASLEKPVYRQQLPVPTSNAAAGFVVRNKGPGPVQVRLVRRGQPDIGESEASSQGLKVSVTYDSSDRFVQGEDIRATVKVTNVAGRQLNDLALTQIVPSGWEIRNDRFEGRQDPSGNFTYRDIRDDRIHTYFSLAPTASKSFEVRLHGTFVGRFYLPPVRVESMYDVAIQGQSAARWIDVVRPGADP